jgi:hypothetical protein
LGLGVLAVAYSVSPLIRDWWVGREWDERLTVGLGTGFVLLVGSYALLGATDLPPYPEDLLVTVLTGAVAMALLAVGYARTNGLELRLSLPDADSYRFALAAVLVPAAVAVLPVVALVATGRLSANRFAELYDVPVEDVQFFEYDPGLAFKVTIPARIPSGSPGDPDLRGAQQHAPVFELEVDVEQST